ncbi:hypothetical protein [Hyalangium gracile]|uniref:hypothetical protein n=1 Tax=Hyalangium gracile TaxID=394092 RepID=UPI001CCAFBB1|nr:hypothetical protein [Hyalangium gracile]
MNAAPFLVLLTVLHQATSTGGYSGGGYSSVEELPQGDASSESSSTSFRLALEVGPLSLPSGTPGGGQDIFAQAMPVARLVHGESFGVELGAPLRLRLLDADPKQTDQDYGGYLRREDWDTLSDLGQILRELRIGRDDNVANLRAGPLQAFTLGEGHLVDRYDNRLSPNYHPTGALLTVNVGPTRVQAMASDVLAPRLFAGEVRLDIGRLASQQDKHFDRYHAIASVAHDFGRVGEEATEAITAVLVGGDAALYKGENLQFFAIGGAGTRVDAGSPDIGGFGGFSIRGNTGRVDISGRVEGRFEGGNFRFGLFGPSYELARYSATGLSEPPLAEERMDKNLAGYAELKLGLGSGAPEEVNASASAAVEHFTTGRTDTDFTLGLKFPGGRTLATARVIIVGIGTQPRYSAHAELRQRILDWLYVWGAGGTVHFPQADGSLVRGYTAGAGAGVDFAR